LDDDDDDAAAMLCSWAWSAALADAAAYGERHRNGVLLLGGMAETELDGVRRITSLNEGEATLITSWAAPPTWHAGRIHPGRGRYLIKSGQRSGSPSRSPSRPARSRCTTPTALAGPIPRDRELGDLTGAAAVKRARTLRPDLGEIGPSDHGLRMLSIGCREVWMSWEDVALVIMGPRSNKTSAITVPTVLATPGLVVATSDKADLRALTAGVRADDAGSTVRRAACSGGRPGGARSAPRRAPTWRRDGSLCRVAPRTNRRRDGAPDRRSGRAHRVLEPVSRRSG
jgi:hypothetical protein